MAEDGRGGVWVEAIGGLLQLAALVATMVVAVAVTGGQCSGAPRPVASAAGTMRLGELAALLPAVGGFLLYVWGGRAGGPLLRGRRGLSVGLLVVTVGCVVWWVASAGHWAGLCAG